MQADANATTEAGVDKINQEWNPEDDDFISETVFAGIVLFAVGVAVLLAFFIYYAVRCVCWTCLGDECCDKRNKVRASQTMVKWNNYAVSLLLLTCIAGGAWLLYAGKPIIDSLDSLTNTMVREAEVVKNAANVTITTVEAAVGNDGSVDLNELKEAEDLLTTAQEDLEVAESDTRDATDSFGGVIIFIGVCAIVCAILGLLCVFVRNIIFLYLYFIIATFTVFALWSLAGFAFVGHKAFDETCKMMELHYQGNPNDYVTDNLPCEDLERAGDSVTEAQLGANAAVEAGNEQLEQLNNDLRPVAQGELEEVPLLCQPYVRQNGNPNGELVPNNETTNGCVQLTAANIEAEYGGLVCPNAEVTEVNQNDPAWLQCAVFADPSTPMPNDTYTDLIARAGQLETLNSELDTIRLITGCGFVDVAFEHITDTECDGLKQNSNRLATAALMSAITLTITSFYFCICIQNIRKQDAPQPAPGEEQFMQAKSP